MIKAPPILLDDQTIRVALRQHIDREYSQCNDFAVIEELGIQRGAVRVDIAVVNGVLHGFEIKSERDSLRRLVRQADYYNRTFDRVTLVTSAHHLQHAAKLVPGWWELLCVQVVNGSVHFESVRHGQPHSSVDPRALAELLWLEKSRELLRQHGLAARTSGLRRAEIWDLLSASLSVDVIRQSVKELLMERAAIEAAALS